MLYIILIVNQTTQMTAFSTNDNLDWAVSKRTICVLGATGEMQPIPGKMATVREDSDKVLGIVGDDYEVLQNEDLKSIVQPLVDEQVITVTNQGFLSGGRKVFIQAEMSESYEVAGEKHKAMLTLLNSHDGTTSVAIGPTFIRVICSNTFASAMTKIDQRFRHSAGVTERVLTSTAVNDFINNALQEYNERVEKLAGTRCTTEQFRNSLEAIYQKPVAEMRDTAVERLVTLFKGGKGNEGANFKDAFNAVTESSSHYSRKTASARFYYSNFGQGANINRRAMKVFTELATV